MKHAFNQTAFNQFIVDHGVIGFFDKPITLKSGRQSNWYVNWRIVANDAFLLDQLSSFVVSYLNDAVAGQVLTRTPDCIYGVPEGATKAAILAQFKLALASPTYALGSHVMAMGRGQPKTHGAPQDRFFVGVPRGDIVVLEDVTTTGGSLLTTIDQLGEAQVEVVLALGLTNRMEKRDDGSSVAEAVGAKRSSSGKPIKYVHMSNALDLLPMVCARKQPTDAIRCSVMQEFLEVGMAPLSLPR